MTDKDLIYWIGRNNELYGDKATAEFLKLAHLGLWARDKAIPAFKNIESLDKFIELSKIGDRRGEWCSLQAKEALEALPEGGK